MGFLFNEDIEVLWVIFGMYDAFFGAPAPSTPFEAIVLESVFYKIDLTAYPYRRITMILNSGTHCLEAGA